MKDFRYMAIVAAAALGLAVAGCSGGGDDGLSTSEEQQLQDDKKAAEAQVATLQTQINALRAQLELDPADNLGDSIEGLQTELTRLQKMVDEAADEREMAAEKAKAADALALFNGFVEDATNLPVTNIAVADRHGGGMASVTADGLTPGVGNNDVTKKMQPMLGKWQGTELSDTNAATAASNPGASSTVVVYTDIEADEPVAFGKVHTLTTQNGADVLAIDADADAKPHTRLISATAFVHEGRKNHDPDPDSASDIARIRGMFNGASGEYRCTAADATTCFSHNAGEGRVRLGAGWVFDPDSGAEAMQADASYAYFGWWLNKGTTEGVEAGAFHGVTRADADQLAAPQNINALGGTATYTGKAAGKYAINPSLSAATGGHWTADATLTADWGNETAAGTISGKIDGFMAGDKPRNWEVKLGETQLSETGTFNTATDSIADTATNAVIWTINGVPGEKSGSWQGALYKEGDNTVPTVATGMFSATHGTAGNDEEVGHMVGAFGAHK